MTHKEREQERQIADLSALAGDQAVDLRRLAGELTRVRQRERQQLAAVLHDELQQLLAAARMRLSMAMSRVPEDARGMLDGVNDLLGQSIESCRTLSTELNPAVLQDSTLPEVLQWLARWMHDKHGLKVSVRTDDGPEPDDEAIRIVLFEAARELLFNAVKHGGVAEASMSLSYPEGNRIRLEVADDGAGFDSADQEHDAKSTSLGLPALRQRVRFVGGSMTVDTAAGAGTRVAVELPLQ